MFALAHAEEEGLLQQIASVLLKLWLHSWVYRQADCECVPVDYIM